MGLLTPLALGVGACAALSGLTDLTQGGDGGAEASVSQPGDERPPQDAFTGVVDTGGARETGGEPDASTSEAPDAVAPPRLDAAADVAVDAAAICRAQCSGCCDTSGTCHGGRSTTTCGTGGIACRDCSGAGEVCSANGTCTAPPPPDAGPPPMCVVSKCTNSCPALPLLEAPCCKLDQTCGCAAVLGLVLCN